MKRGEQSTFSEPLPGPKNGIGRFRGRSCGSGQVPHLPSGFWLGLAVKMQFHARFGNGGGPVGLSVLPKVAQEVCHRCGAVKFGRTEREAADRANLLLEL